MTFERAHEAFIAEHLSKRSGERKGRLERGHREAEKLFCKNVWWRLRGSFDGLHPEYEVRDWRGMSYFCDFIWIGPGFLLIIEIKGFGPHVRDMDRQRYCNELNRETFLTGMGYQVVSFSYDDVAERPELCITLLRLLMSRYQTQTAPLGANKLIEGCRNKINCLFAVNMQSRGAGTKLTVYSQLTPDDAEIGRSPRRLAPYSDKSA